MVYTSVTGSRPLSRSSPPPSDVSVDPFKEVKDPAVVTGADIFAFLQNNGQDTIHDFEQGKDHIALTALTNLMSFAAVKISSDGLGDSVIDLGQGNTITLAGLDPNALTANDFYFAAQG